jgi:serine/threonine protein kinase
MSNAPKDAKGIFLAALDIGDAAERAAFVQRSCSDDAALRQRVEDLLRAYGQSNGPLDKLAAALAPTEMAEPIREQVGATIGPYKLMEQIGEGGFGLVFVAEQQQPIRRKVALKIIKPGMDTRDVIARFEAERQALALMDHPNIARVLDAGTTESGRPYFVMELVRGIPITDYCDKNQLTPRERLELFIPVCNAIQHAHLKGIIHRDIKPSNVLVTMHDGKPVVKVIDFGVAKALHQSLTDRTVYTRFAQMIGTPLYMSPEQAEMSGLDIDTRTDVYSLGVLLYELLTGTTPLDKKRLAQAAYDELLKIIREDDPPKPSVRLSQSTDSLASIAALRKTDPAKLSKMFHGDVDWIAMKALEKDRTRRYETANAFAADVLRYLNDEPIEACPPSAGYRLRKVIRKHRVAITTASAFVGLLIVATGVTGVLAIKARRAEAEAKANSDVAKELAQSRAIALSRLSERERQLRLELSNAAITASSKQIDLDLSEATTDPRSALLRVARSNQTLSSIQIPRLDGQVDQDQLSRLRELRTFVAAAIVALGQGYAPLLSLPTNDSNESSGPVVSTDGRNVLTYNAGMVRLWDLRTAIGIALLRQGTEKIVKCGFSPDGKTIYTNDTDSVLRFWATNDGRFLSKSGLRESRFVYPEKLSSSQIAFISDHANHVHMTNSTALVESHKLTNVKFGNGSNGSWSNPANGTAELIDVATGRLVARLDRPGHKIEKFRVSPDGRWIIAVEDNTQIVILWAADGREAGRLFHPPQSFNLDVWVSPNTRRIMTRLPAKQGRNDEPPGGCIRLWEANPWRRVPDPVLDRLAGDRVARFLTDDLVEAGGDDDGGGIVPELVPPAGRRFHPAVKRLTNDGRFLFSDDNITDTATEKGFPFAWGNPQKPKYFARFGTVGIDYGLQVRILPSPEYLEGSPVLLELWAQVAARGHLDNAGTFVKWDELTWEQRRQELASKPVPYANFPFPGRLARDRLYWLRQEFENAKNDDKPRLAKQLLDRAHQAENKVEAARWTEVVAGHVVDSLISKLLLRAEVVQRLRQDLTLESDIRAAALAHAERLTENATNLNAQSWRVAVLRDAPKADCERALRWAQEAVELGPNNPDFLNTLGVLQYRNGLYKEAVATLTRSHEAYNRKGTLQPADLGFLAMTHHALGNAAEAQAFFRRLTDVLKQENWKSNDEAKALFEEAKRTLATKP